MIYFLTTTFLSFLIAQLTFDFIAENGWYVYIETSTPRRNNDPARLVSAPIPAGQTYCLEFWYYMYGAHISAFNFYIMVCQKLSVFFKSWNVSVFTLYS